MIRLTLKSARPALLVLALVLIAAFGAQAQDMDSTLRIGVTAPQTLDPAFGSNDPEILFNRSIYDYLIEVLPDTSIAPTLATDWTISEDGLTYTFTLVDNATFHDGSPLTSADVVYTFNRLKELDSPALNLLGDFELSAPDATTVIFTLAAPSADFLYGVADRFALIIQDGEENPGQAFNGSGPFMVEDFDVASGRAVLVRNPNYWKEGQPLLDRVEFIFIEDPITQVNALVSGEVDFIFKISADQLGVVEMADGITLQQRATNQHPVVRLRTDIEPGDNPLVRQAFKLTTDREQLNELILDGRGVIGNNDPIGPGFGVFHNDSIENPAYDPEAACALLAEAGYPDGLEMTLQTINVLGYDDMAAVLQQQWAEGCIRVDIQVNEEGFYYSDDNPDNWLQAPLGITGWGDRPVPQGLLVSAYTTGGPFNETHWSDPELDALIAAAGTAGDLETRIDLYYQIAEIFADRGPIIVPWFAPIFGAASDRVTGLNMAPFPGLTDLRTVSVEG